MTEQLTKACPTEYRKIIRELDELDDRIRELAKAVKTDSTVKARTLTWIGSLTWDDCGWAEHFVARKFADQLGINGSILKMRSASA